MLVDRQLHLQTLFILQQVLHLRGLRLVFKSKGGDAFILDSRDVKVLDFLALEIIHEITNHGLLEAVDDQLGSLDTLRVVLEVFHLILLVEVHVWHHLLQLLVVLRAQCRDSAAIWSGGLRVCTLSSLCLEALLPDLPHNFLMVTLLICGGSLAIRLIPDRATAHG